MVLVQKQGPKPNIHEQVGKSTKKFKLPEKKVMDVILKALELYMKTDEFQSLIEE